MRARGPGMPVRETLEGQSFITDALTPFLLSAVRRSSEALSAAIDAGGAHAEVVALEPMVIGRRTLVVPDVVVRHRGVVLVIELRSESTERYALGMKRLAYQEADVPEYWFLEPRERRLKRLCLIDRYEGYRWPPETVGDGAHVDLLALPGVRVAVRDLLPSGAHPRWHGI